MARCDHHPVMLSSLSPHKTFARLIVVSNTASSRRSRSSSFIAVLHQCQVVLYEKNPNRLVYDCHHHPHRLFYRFFLRLPSSQFSVDKSAIIQRCNIKYVANQLQHPRFPTEPLETLIISYLGKTSVGVTGRWGWGSHHSLNKPYSNKIQE